jgi:hypothetical protein
LLNVRVIARDISISPLPLPLSPSIESQVSRIAHRCVTPTNFAAPRAMHHAPQSAFDQSLLLATPHRRRLVRVSRKFDSRDGKLVGDTMLVRRLLIDVFLYTFTSALVIQIVPPGCNLLNKKCFLSAEKVFSKVFSKIPFSISIWSRDFCI